MGGVFFKFKNKMKNLRNKVALLVALISFFANAQVGIGTPTPEAALDITATNDGLLIPRVALTTTTSALPLTLPTTSELIYNSATIADVTPGYYYWNGTLWIRLAAGTTGWLTIGNTGIVDGTNFIGTAAGTNVDVAFRRNNAAAGKIGTTSTSFGVGALTANTGSFNTGLGVNALQANVGSQWNTAIGYGAMARSNGAQNAVAIGYNALANAVGNGNLSVAIGINALGSCNVDNNTAVGANALSANPLTGLDNVAVGKSSLLQNSSGANNTAVGSEALSFNGTSGNNVGIGYRALRAGGGNSVGIGANALLNNAASGSTAVGYNALTTNTSAVDNTALGAYALSNVSTAGNSNTAVGVNALRYGDKFQNTAIGKDAQSSTAPGNNCTSVGWGTLAANTADFNVAVGGDALRSVANALSVGNTAIGYNALKQQTGADNTGVGFQSGFSSGAGAQNVFVGSKAGFFNTFGSYNVTLGYLAGYNNAVGNTNVYIGQSAGFNNTTSGNVNIGYQAGANETTANKLYIANSNANATNALIYGDFASKVLRTNGTFQIGDPAGTGYVFPATRGTVNQYLASNASGVLSWTSPDPVPNSGLSAARNNLSSSQTLSGLGWEKIIFDTEDFDTNAELSASTFTATKAGIYQVNAGYHTNGQANTQFYSIAVYINGVMAQKVSANHYSNGPVSRAINNTFSLTAGNTVEIYIENYITGALIDSGFGKAFFEIIQIR